jgi:subtilisin family serine protease
LEYNNQYGLGKIKASSAYARGYTGAGVTVAVIDSGFDTTHPDLAGNMLAGIDVVDGDTNVNNPDTLYHGNWVSGVVAGVRSGVGTHGVAYDAKILPIRAGGDRGFSFVGLASAVDVARNSSDVDVINLSLGTRTFVEGPDPRDDVGRVFYETTLPKTRTIGAIDPAYITALANAEAASKVVVFAAGNDGFNSVNGAILFYDDPNANPVGSLSANSFFTISGATTLFDRNQSSFDARLPVISGSPVGTGTWLNVVATDQNNTIASFSNGCGEYD